MLNDCLPNPEAEWGHDPHFVAQCAGQPDVLWQQNHSGVFTSNDGAQTWKRVSRSDVNVHFGFPIAVDERDGRTAWVVPAKGDDERMALAGGIFVARTSDGGATWQTFREGLPQEHAYDTVYRHALDARGNHVCFGSTTGNLYVSEDRGETWRCVGNKLPPIHSIEPASAVVASGSPLTTTPSARGSLTRRPESEARRCADVRLGGAAERRARESDVSFTSPVDAGIRVTAATQTVKRWRHGPCFGASRPCGHLLHAFSSWRLSARRRSRPAARARHPSPSRARTPKRRWCSRTSRKPERPFRPSVRVRGSSRPVSCRWWCVFARRRARRSSPTSRLGACASHAVPSPRSRAPTSPA